MVDSNRILGPFFFVFFTSIVAVLLLTIFLGLLRESYVLADDQNDRIGRPCFPIRHLAQSSHHILCFNAFALKMHLQAVPTSRLV